MVWVSVTCLSSRLDQWPATACFSHGDGKSTRSQYQPLKHIANFKSANIPLTKASHTAQPRVEGWGSTLSHHEATVTVRIKILLQGSGELVFGCAVEYLAGDGALPVNLSWLT